MKNIGKLFLATSIMLIFAIQAQSQTSTKSTNPPKQNTAKPGSATFTDTNKNGICDNFESRSGSWHGRNFVDKNNDGICDNVKNRSGQGQGRNFVDKNNDGICDNRPAVGKQCGNCCGRHYRNGHGNGWGNGHGQGQGQGQGQK